MEKKESFKNKNLAEKLKIISSIAGSLLKILVIVIIGLWILSLVLPSIQTVSGNIAIIPLSGTITSDGIGAMFTESASAEKISSWINTAAASSEIKAIVLEINSPGGSPVATNEIVTAVKNAKLLKPVYAVIRESGASGAYWVASACNKIFADKMSMTGSIGVLGSYLEYSGLLKDYNVTYQRIVAGQYKDFNSPYKELMPYEKTLIQKKINLIYDVFVEDVAANRNISVEEMRGLATGEVYTGIEAKQLGLINEFGSLSTAIAELEKKLNITADVYEFSSAGRLFSGFGGLTSKASFYIGEGIGSALAAKASSNEINVRT